jgi:integrase
MALTFVRTSELIGARWSEFDFKAARWNIPAERMKMKTPHIVPLSRQSLEVLAKLRAISFGNQLVFPGDVNPLKPMSNNTLLFALYRMGYRGRMTGHGFRGVDSRSFTSRAGLTSTSSCSSPTRSGTRSAPRITTPFTSSLGRR